MSAKKEPGAVLGMAIQSAVDRLFSRNQVVTSIKIKYPGIDPLLIIQTKTTEGPMIAFIGGRNLDEIGKNLQGMAVADQIKWRSDEWELKRLAGTADT